MIVKRAKKDLLNGRYALKNCLFANDLGHLYHARDTQHSSPTSFGSPVLIHFIPSQAISYNDVPTLFKRLQTIIKTLNHPILPVMDYGWNGTESYFVIAAPDSWSVKVLPELQSSALSSLHKTAMTISGALHKSGHTSRRLPPQAFLVIPGGLKLLGTALIKQLQVIQPEKNLLPPPSTYRIDKKTVIASLGLTMLTGVLLAQGHDFYLKWQHIQTATVGPDVLSKEPVLPETQFLSVQTQAPATSTLLDSSWMGDLSLPTPTLYHLAQAAPQPNRDKVTAQPLVQVPTEKKPVVSGNYKTPHQHGALQTMTASEPKKTVIQKTTKSSALKKVKNAKQPRKDTRGKKNQPAVAEKQQTPIPLVAKAFPEKLASPDKNTANQMITTKPRLTANGLNSEQLKNKAYAALSSGALDEKPDTGSIFYIRLLKRIDAKNPHIQRLARGVVLAYHAQVRQEIKQQQKQESKRLLWVAGRVIKEFNLTQMNQAHTMLKRRQSE